MTPEKIVEYIEWIITENKISKSLTADETLDEIYEFICEEYY